MSAAAQHNTQGWNQLNFSLENFADRQLFTCPGRPAPVDTVDSSSRLDERAQRGKMACLKNAFL